VVFCYGLLEAVAAGSGGLADGRRRLPGLVRCDAPTVTGFGVLKGADDLTHFVEQDDVFEAGDDFQNERTADGDAVPVSVFDVECCDAVCGAGLD